MQQLRRRRASHPGASSLAETVTRLQVCNRFNQGREDCHQVHMTVHPPQPMIRCSCARRASTAPCQPTVQSFQKYWIKEHKSNHHAGSLLMVCGIFLSTRVLEDLDIWSYPISTLTCGAQAFCRPNNTQNLGSLCKNSQSQYQNCLYTIQACLKQPKQQALSGSQNFGRTLRLSGSLNPKPWELRVKASVAKWLLLEPGRAGAPLRLLKASSWTAGDRTPLGFGHMGVGLRA